MVPKDLDDLHLMQVGLIHMDVNTIVNNTIMQKSMH